MLHIDYRPLHQNLYAMVYLDNFKFPSSKLEAEVLDPDPSKNPENYWNKDLGSLYPFFILSGKILYSLYFKPITIIYGSNGSGKSTVINVISYALNIQRNSLYNSTAYMERYCNLCTFKTNLNCSGDESVYLDKRESKYDISEISRVITSDDIFKIMLDDRLKKEQLLYKSKVISKEISAIKDLTPKDPLYKRMREMNFETGENLEEYKEFMEMRKTKSFAKYLKEKLGPIERGFSNGENSMMYLAEEIQKEGLYLLDEPENSMSPKFQKDLADLIRFYAGRYNSQFIIATHSPFLLAIPNAKIYNLDEIPVKESKMWELESMKDYYNLFKSYSDKFENH